MTRLWKWIHSSISRRLFCYFALLALVPLMLEAVTLVFNTHISRRIVAQLTQERVENSISRLEQVFDEAVTVSHSLQGHAEFQSRMRRTFKGQAELFSDDLEGDMELASILSGHNSLAGVYLLGTNGLCCKSNADSFLYSNYFVQSWYQETIAGHEGRWYVLHDGSFVARTANNNYISYTEPYINRATGLCSGVIVTEINEAVLMENLSIQSDMGMFLLLDAQGGLIDRTEANWATQREIERICAAAGGGVNSTLNVDGAMVVCRRSANTGWLLVGVVPASYINQGGLTMVSVGIGCAGLVVLLAIWVSYLVSRSFTRPIIRVTNAMAMVEEGDLSLRLEETGEDETAKLSQGFNHMVARIEQLMASIYEQQSMLRRSEFKALQSQINPHFLYNSLDSIAWLIRMEQLNEAKMMVQSLSTLFRIALSKGHELIPIESELKHLQSYIAIQTIRYSKKFTFGIDVEDELREYVTLKLMLQPLVENCIYHGLSVERPMIHIHVSVTGEGEDIVFRVSDDGAGMPPEKLEALRASISRMPEESDLTKDASGGYGLPNINGRVRVYFGEQYGMTIDSRVMEGTTVTIRIPRVKEAEA